MGQPAAFYIHICSQGQKNKTAKAKKELGDMKLNFIKIENGVLKWRQMELDGDRTYIRYKRRKVRVYRK